MGLEVTADGAGGCHQGLAHDLPAEKAPRHGHPVVLTPNGRMTAAVSAADSAAGRAGGAPRT